MNQVSLLYIKCQSSFILVSYWLKEDQDENKQFLSCLVLPFNFTLGIIINDYLLGPRESSMFVISRSPVSGPQNMLFPSRPGKLSIWG